MFKVIIELFFLYLLYKLIFDFIIPVYQTTKQVKQKMSKIQQDVNDHLQRQNNQFTTNTRSETKTSSKKSDDYIDFEEVK